MPHGARADLLVVSAALPDGGTGLFLVAGDASGLDPHRLRAPTTAAARPASRSTAPPPPRWAPPPTRPPSSPPPSTRARIAAGNEAVGAMEFALDATSEYLKSRKQFGVPLKTFQALTFRAADMYVSLELASSVAVWATMVLASGAARRQEVAERGRARRPAGQPGRRGTSARRRSSCTAASR